MSKPLFCGQVIGYTKRKKAISWVNEDELYLQHVHHHDHDPWAESQ